MNNYGNTFMFILEIECESSVMLSEQHALEKVKDVEEYLNEEICNRKKKLKHVEH